MKKLFLTSAFTIGVLCQASQVKADDLGSCPTNAEGPAMPEQTLTFNKSVPEGATFKSASIIRFIKLPENRVNCVYKEVSGKMLYLNATVPSTYDFKSCGFKDKPGTDKCESDNPSNCILTCDKLLVINR